MIYSTEVLSILIS